MNIDEQAAAKAIKARCYWQNLAGERFPRPATKRSLYPLPTRWATPRKPQNRIGEVIFRCRNRVAETFWCEEHASILIAELGDRNRASFHNVD